MDQQMELAYGIVFLALTAVICYAVYLWWNETEERERCKEEEITKIKDDISSLKEKNRRLEEKQKMMERNVVKVFQVLDPLGKNMYYEK